MNAVIGNDRLQDELSTPYPLDPGAVTFYREKGYVKLRQVLSPAVLAHYGSIITDLVIRLNTLIKPMEERTTYERAFLQIMNLWQEDEQAKEFVFSKRLAQLATDLMGVQGVRLYHDQALYKEPSGGITPWHADQFYWPLSSPNTTTVWIPLQETPMEMGPLAFAEGSQHVEIGRDIEISDDSEAILASELQKQNFSLNNTPFDLGEVSFHAGWTFHRAGPNLSETPRKVMTMIYMDKDQVITAPRNRFQVADHAKWLANVPVGNHPQDALNPVLFSY
ncbi:phytanoyl-CoA dioxygenase family protein [Spirosoma utsteinense]|uniref:Ectoine hydroxylase-related dioxygenase (Phytanoyl-CoA dioxygenase family) n=1 Tax=Spirosoma utsteinense TaxID=2585773 RepID=A0ABR6W946_9BACT|nr:phytanoyl-CoA dioxygenase family protein [Spirosoma utsteinense]MBC3784915.1 ectoine hydroxylase-related dioxygenase (phytanoyl-CoA dioxygenase family) [Spirosoma utsteinense]MBC3792476.1 ectoine hydroxylase-related dioxygenase (phytanoyl-CoA dioxygenase family) [Spirosoma utsteinense]